MSEGISNDRTNEPSGEGQASDPEGEVSLLDLAIVLAKHKKMIIGLPMVVALIAIGVALSRPDIYTGTTRILPPQPTKSAAQLENLTGLAAGVPPVRNVNDLYIGMLKSRTVADILIQKFDLNRLYGQTYQSYTRKALEGRTQITSGKDGIITIEVDDLDPRRAAALANAYVEALFELSNVLAITEASQRRLFFERQLAVARNNLANAEKAARSGLESGGLASVEVQSRGILETTARLRAQITAKEIELSAMRTFAADKNPDLLRGRQELLAMQRQLGSIEGTTRGGNGEGSTGAPGLENVHLLREVRYHEVLSELLAKQYEIARIDEANNAAIIQVLDKAIEPDRKSKPNRRQMVWYATFVAGLLAVLWAFLSEALARFKADPNYVRRLAVLRSHLRLRNAEKPLVRP
jgi:tyrosine-protein kinase Etk/Wzc